MSNDIAFALAALVCYGLGDFIYKRAAGAGMAAEHFLMTQAWFFCPAMIVYAAITGTLHPAAAAGWGGLAGLFVLVGFLNYVRSLRTGPVSIVAPVFRLNFLITAALAIAWLNEPLTTAKLAGCALALLAGWLLLGAAASGDTRGPVGRGSIVQVAVATLAMGSANFCYKLGLIDGATPETMLVAQALVFTALVTGLGYATNRSLRVPADVIPYSAAAAVVLLLAFLFLLHALRHGQASVVVPIAQVGFGIAAVLGVVLLREVLTPRKIAGLCAAAGALLVLALG